MNKQYGLDLQKELQDQKVTDFVFGSTAPISGLAESIPFEKYLPVGEVQRGAEDTMDCATRGPMNILEDKFTYLYQVGTITGFKRTWLEQKGYVVDGRVTFSDAFTAIKSGTTRQGNSLIAPLDSAHRDGLVPKQRLPMENWMRWSDYHNKARITKELTDLGLEFLKLFDIKYERVLKKDFDTIVSKDIIDVAGFAWPSPVNGIYPRVDDRPNHCFIFFKKPTYTIFDNYVDSVDGDFVKRLASNYALLDYGYRVVVNFTSYEISTEMVRRCWVNCENIRNAFRAENKFVDAGDPTYTIYDWAKEYGVYDHAEYFQKEYQGKEKVVQIEATNLYFLPGPGGGSVQDPAVIENANVEVMIVEDAREKWGIDTTDSKPVYLKKKTFWQIIKNWLRL